MTEFHSVVSCGFLGHPCREGEMMNRFDNTLNLDNTQPQGNSPNFNAEDDLGGQQTIRVPGSGSLVFGRYRLQRVLGRGGMGIVWLAVDTKLERAVALKFLPDIIGADPVALRELKDETRRGLDLAHPNIVRIYDFLDDDDAAAISMEFVDGKTLAENRLNRPHKVFSAEELAPWVSQMCDALDYAHIQRRIVHRDLKPANLMVNAESQIRITDFGIARSVCDTMSRLTINHANTSGTLLYMSPQQALGDRPRPTDDIYSIGATIYELLTGKPPFYSGDISLQITAKTAPSLKQRREELEIAASDDIPKEWEIAIASCLDKDPARRPQTAGELAQRLSAASNVRAEGRRSAITVKSSTGLQSVPLSSTTRHDTKVGAALTNSSSSKKPLIAAAAALALLGTAGAATYWWMNRPSGWVVQTEPVGAQVTINGKTLTAPATFGDLKPGYYRANIASDGYEPKDVSFDIKAGEKAESGLVKLTRSTGSVLISSDPDGVDFEITLANDENAPKIKGETPKTLVLPIGHYEVTLKHKGELKTTEIKVERDKEVAQTFKFAPPPPPVVPVEDAPIVHPETPVVAGAAMPQPEVPASPGSVFAHPSSEAPANSNSNPNVPPNGPAPSQNQGTPSATNGLANANPTGNPGNGTALPNGAAPAQPGTETPGAPPANGADAGPPAPGAQVAVAEPASGFWKLDEMFAHSSYNNYSQSGRRYLLYKAQQSLKEKSHYSSTIDGQVGKGTHKALQNFQATNALQPTGQLDEATIAALGLTGQEDKSDWDAPRKRSPSKSKESEEDDGPNWWSRNVGNVVRKVFR